MARRAAGNGQKGSATPKCCLTHVPVLIHVYAQPPAMSITSVVTKYRLAAPLVSTDICVRYLQPVHSLLPQVHTPTCTRSTMPSGLPVVQRCVAGLPLETHSLCTYYPTQAATCCQGRSGWWRTGAASHSPVCTPGGATWAVARGDVVRRMTEDVQQSVQVRLYSGM